MYNPYEALDKRLSAIEFLLLELKQSLSYQSCEKESEEIGIDEVAAMLQLSKATVYTKTSQKTIPFRKVGKHLIFSRKQIKELIASGEVKTLREEFRLAQKLVADKINKNTAPATY